MALLTVDNLMVYFHTRNGIVKAVDGISFAVEQGKTVGIVGESGSGKSVSCYSLLGLIPCPPGRIESGTALFNGIDLLSCTQRELQRVRQGMISMIFQDPMTSLNPYLTVGYQLTEALLLEKRLTKGEARKKALQSLVEVGIHDGEKRLTQYPHEFSGGMRQRVMIAMALMTGPKLLIADEPTTALDVTIQAQILDVIKKMQREHGTAVIFITHDLGVIAGISDEVIVMYGGKIMEQGDTGTIYYHHSHPYTRALLDSIPSTHKPGDELYTIPGHPPDVSKPISGCPFAPRCEYTFSKCLDSKPVLKKIEAKHYTACFNVFEKPLNRTTTRSSENLT